MKKTVESSSVDWKKTENARIWWKTDIAEKGPQKLLRGKKAWSMTHGSACSTCPRWKSNRAANAHVYVQAIKGRHGQMPAALVDLAEELPKRQRTIAQCGLGGSGNQKRRSGSLW